jgi:hypothetical protein
MIDLVLSCIIRDIAELALDLTSECRFLLEIDCHRRQRNALIRAVRIGCVQAWVKGAGGILKGLVPN